MSIGTTSGRRWMLMESGKVFETSTIATVATKLLKEHIVLGYDLGLQA
jgi:hypothetical protein